MRFFAWLVGLIFVLSIIYYSSESGENRTFQDGASQSSAMFDTAQPSPMDNSVPGIDTVATPDSAAPMNINESVDWHIIDTIPIKEVQSTSDDLELDLHQNYLDQLRQNQGSGTITSANDFEKAYEQLIEDIDRLSHQNFSSPLPRTHSANDLGVDLSLTRDCALNTTSTYSSVKSDRYANRDAFRLSSYPVITTSGYIPTYSPRTASTNDVYVSGYFRNGTYVAPHYRTAPNSTKTDNFSSYPNINPYTGKMGTKRN